MKSYFFIIACSMIFKILLAPSYISTDFEVHRNWLAITNSLSIKDWYYENTSQWTLDYPPLFAWFEYGLSLIAQYIDPLMLKLDNLNYASNKTVAFQRATVIVSDSVFYYSIFELRNILPFLNSGKQSSTSSYENLVLLTFLTAFNFGLIIIDHIHFQYNGFLTGFQILSIIRLVQNRPLESAFLFSILLNLKHIYLYIAPSYFIYLLSHYCFYTDKSSSVSKFSLYRFITLGLAVISVFGISFGPFIAFGQLDQVLSRLFPFKRGLCHAYWAPNFWSLYNVADKILSVMASKVGVFTPSNTSASMTGGLVQEFDHSILPNVRPFHTVVLTALAIMPMMWKLWKCRVNCQHKFLESLIVCALAAFVFGWHVHEKAILLAILPFTLLIFLTPQHAQIWLYLTGIGHYSLFPLIFTPAETPVRTLLYLLFTVASIAGLERHFPLPPHVSTSWYLLHPLSRLQSLHLLGLVPLFIYTHCVHHFLGLQQKLPFLPLLLTSVYCAVGVCWGFIKFYRLVFNDVPCLYKAKVS